MKLSLDKILLAPCAIRKGFSLGISNKHKFRFRIDNICFRGNTW